jgi:hypothetical protein
MSATRHSSGGECLNYAAHPRATHERLGGLFLCDVAEPGPQRRVPRRVWHEGPDWLLRPYARQEVLAKLVSAGFRSRMLAGYGRAVRFRRGHAGMLAREARHLYPDG